MIRHVERLTDSRLLPGWLVREHEARYLFCRGRVAGKIVLDCGSGEGKGSKSIAAGGSKLLVALDRAVGALALARGPGVAAVAAQGERLAVRDQAVDVVIALEVIEHMDDPEGFLAEAARVLRTGGILICSTPNRAVRNPGLPLSGRPLNPWHLREWTPDEFRALLAAHFARIELFGQEPQSQRTTRRFERLAAVVSCRAGAVLRQLLKMIPARRSYEVAAPADGVDYEFAVAVCSAPRSSAPAR